MQFTVDVVLWLKVFGFTRRRKATKAIKNCTGEGSFIILCADASRMTFSPNNLCTKPRHIARNQSTFGRKHSDFLGKQFNSSSILWTNSLSASWIILRDKALKLNQRFLLFELKKLFIFFNVRNVKFLICVYNNCQTVFTLLFQ